ncbi:MAG: YicC family protein [Cytophagales bacterium]|nr:YicC family protein [Cytophagales bacterium]
MIRSMTGYGQANVETDKQVIAVEVRALNSKSQDFSVRLPRQYNEKELELRTLIGKKLERGKVSVSLEVQSKGELKAKLTVNRELVKAYYKDIESTYLEINPAAHGFDIFRIALSLPDAYISDQATETSAADSWPIVLGAIENALDDCNKFRDAEGATLQEKLTGYITTIRSLLAKVAQRDPERLLAIRERVRTHLGEVISDDHFDANRFEQEMVYFVEKLDIEEEKTRLATHLDYFMETMLKGDDCGRKLGFIAQEIGREINTIGSKANDSTIQKLVVEMKEELEKIKEQSMNIL